MALLHAQLRYMSKWDCGVAYDPLCNRWELVVCVAQTVTNRDVSAAALKLPLDAYPIKTVLKLIFGRLGVGAYPRAMLCRLMASAMLGI